MTKALRHVQNFEEIWGNLQRDKVKLTLPDRIATQAFIYGITGLKYAISGHLWHAIIWLDAKLLQDNSIEQVGYSASFLLFTRRSLARRAT